MIRLLVVDDHEVVRRGLLRLFATAPDIEVVAAVGDGNAALHAVLQHRPDVVLMDLTMPHLEGVGATRLIVDHDPDLRVIVLTGTADRRIEEALAAGAHTCLLKDVDPDELIATVRAAAPDAPAAPAPEARVTSGLTEREMETLTHLADGRSNRQIAERMSISERTVKAHLTSAYRVIGAQDRVQAALWGRRNLLGSGS
jgi:DNA-binding NarL/FixJ family response regulator